VPNIHYPFHLKCVVGEEINNFAPCDVLDCLLLQADAMRAEFIPGKYLKVSEFAFTHTTPNGTDFASKYVKQPEFLTYTSAIEGVV
jgi:hypothetical protein